MTVRLTSIQNLFRRMSGPSTMIYFVAVGSRTRRRRRLDGNAWMMKAKRHDPASYGPLGELKRRVAPPRTRGSTGSSIGDCPFEFEEVVPQTLLREVDDDDHDHDDGTAGATATSARWPRVSRRRPARTRRTHRRHRSSRGAPAWTRSQPASAGTCARSRRRRHLQIGVRHSRSSSSFSSRRSPDGGSRRRVCVCAGPGAGVAPSPGCVAPRRLAARLSVVEERSDEAIDAIVSFILGAALCLIGRVERVRTVGKAVHAERGGESHELVQLVRLERTLRAWDGWWVNG